MKLKVLKDEYSILKLPGGEKIPAWLDLNDRFLSITRTEDELSIVCKTSTVPENCNLSMENNWIIFKFDEILDFSLTGILAKISKILSEHQISIYALSTFDTDYILIQKNRKQEAVHCLSAGYDIYEE